MITFSIIQKSQLESTNRIDADYYDPECLRLDLSIKSVEHKRFGDLIEILTDYTSNGSFAGLRQNVHVGDDINYAKWIRIQNLDNNNFNENIRYVDELSYHFLKKSKLNGEELLFSKTGEYLGKAYIMPYIEEKATLADNIFLIKLKNLNLNEFIVTFINSKIGRKLILRRIQGTGQPTIIKESLRDFLIPIPDDKTNEVIKQLYIKSKSQLDQSESYYQKAENLLLDELGLKGYKIEDDLFFIVNLSEVNSSQRTDAEYFQPKYQKLFSIIKTRNPKLLGEIASIKKGFEPGSEAYQEEGKNFIRVSSLTKFGFDDGDQKYINNDLYNKLKADFEPNEEEILLTKDATPGISYLIKEPFEGIISGGILRLKTKTDIDPEYLSLVINSIVGQWQAQRDAGGAIIVHWRPEQIKNMMIPILSQETQQKIADLVRKSHESRKKSKDLLDEAKRKVEEMIEKVGDKNVIEAKENIKKFNQAILTEEF